MQLPCHMHMNTDQWRRGNPLRNADMLTALLCGHHGGSSTNQPAHTTNMSSVRRDKISPSGPNLELWKCTVLVDLPHNLPCDTAVLNVPPFLPQDIRQCFGHATYLIIDASPFPHTLLPQDFRWRADLVPSRRPLGRFEGNTAHSTGYFWIMAGGIYFGGVGCVVSGQVKGSILGWCCRRCSVQQSYAVVLRLACKRRPQHN